jgi:hypothetical protein
MIDKILYVQDLDDSFTFVSDSQNVQEIKSYLGPEAAPYDSFFVLERDGEYVEVFGMNGIVPYLTKLVFELEVP